MPYLSSQAMASSYKSLYAVAGYTPLFLTQDRKNDLNILVSKNPSNRQISALNIILYSFPTTKHFSWQCQFSVASLILSFKRKRMFVCMCVWYIFNKLEKLHKCEPIGRKSLSDMVLGKVSESILLTNVDKSPV